MAFPPDDQPIPAAEYPELPHLPASLRGSRYAAASRRALLRRMSAGAAALAFGLTACGGSNDADVFATGASTTSAVTVTSSTAAASTTASTAAAPSTTKAAAAAPTTAAPTTAAPTTAAPTTAKAAAAPTTAAPTTAAPAPAAPATVSGQLAVKFSYAAAGAGRVRNPYVAVWVETPDGALVDTVALWFLQDSKGSRWLPDLRRWNSVDGSQSTIDTISSATRTPGDYSLAWDLKDANGAAVPAGSYVLCIEAAREHGPYSLIRESFTLGSGAASVALQPNGELTNASIALVR